MKRAYTVTVLDDGTLACRDRIALEVRFAAELERLLGGAEQVVGVSRAAMLAKNVGADAQRWTTALNDAAQAVRQDGAITKLEFQVRLDQAATPAHAAL
jgi:hypothetical protein